MVNPRPPVYLFIGSDSYLREKAVKDLTASITGGSSRDLDSKVFYGGEAEPAQVLDQLNTIPFLASKRLVIIKNLEDSSADLAERLVRYIKKPLSSTCLVLESADDSFLTEHDGIASFMTVRRFDAMGPAESAAWIREYLAARGKKTSAEAIALLREMHGRNFSSLAQELDKLAAFTGSKAEVGISDIEEVSGKSLVSSTFDLADAIGQARTKDALSICHDLVTSGKKEYEIVGLLCWHLKRILRAKTLQSKGESDAAIASMLRISQQYRSGFFRQVSRLSLTQLRSKIRALLEADLDIKRTRFDQNLVLECVIVNLCRAA